MVLGTSIKASAGFGTAFLDRVDFTTDLKSDQCTHSERSNLKTRIETREHILDLISVIRFSLGAAPFWKSIRSLATPI